MSQSTLPSDDKPTSFILPDLVSHCTFKLSYNPHGDEIAAQSVKWLDTNCPDLNAKQRRALYGLQAGELTAYCYNTATPERLRVVSDFMNYLFHLDNISDGMMTRETDVLADVVMNALWLPERYEPCKDQPAEELNPGKLARDFWARGIPDCGPGAQARFKETLGLFFESVNIQTRARDEGVIPDLESYIDVRRDTSGCKPCWALIEYALDIDLPDFVAEHPVIAALNQGTNDLVTWSNDIFSFNVEQSRGDTHNMIVILMQHHGHSLQSAIDYVGDLCQQTIDTFCSNKNNLPSWGPEIDDIVARYVQGLQDWIVGSLHWSFQTHRYFGAEGQAIKKHRMVKLLPLQTNDPLPPSPSPAPVPSPESTPEPVKMGKSDRKERITHFTISDEELWTLIKSEREQPTNFFVSFVTLALTQLARIVLGPIFAFTH
ncbi:terpenoid synthase [Coprinopsis marcescibilis]|uniref:Terpene synthase n=1 Tax=Coprinopsis marcescibilis TaxID=230819 RepID=A0A5C3LB45_COPMA|nr:terpenoid synthase [Coprinopsis marcescibilis]